MIKARRIKKFSLAIVEKVFRGALEEQYGNIVWLSECMKSMGASHNLLLCGHAVSVCFDSQKKQSMRIGDLEVRTLSHFSESVRNLMLKGARIWVLKEDFERYSCECELLEGVEIAESMSAICLEHDKVWFW